MARSRTKSWWMAACLAAHLGCAKETGPAAIHVFGLDLETRRYGFFDARLQTLDDAHEMRGGAARMVGGATIVADVLRSIDDPKDPAALRAEGGGAPRCLFADQGGVLFAEDFDSLAMASTYWALERARATFVGLGLGADETRPLAAYYNPTMEVATKLVPTFWLMTDNAAYAPPFDGFLVLPHLNLQDVPFFANLGVMTHEFGHKVFNALVDRNANVPRWRANDWPLHAAHQLRGVDEGLSDVFGGLATGDPDFIRPSIASRSDLNIDRSMATRRIVSVWLIGDWLSDSPDASPDPHGLGAYVAAALWQHGEALGDRARVGRAILEAERDLGAAIDAEALYDFSVLGFFDLYARRFLGADRDAFCAIVGDRFSALLAADAAHRGGACP